MNGSQEQMLETLVVNTKSMYLQVTVEKAAQRKFFFSTDGKTFKPIGQPFQAQPGKWIGAKIGLFAARPHASENGGYSDFDFFRFE